MCADIARRLVEHKRWRWVEGMFAICHDGFLWGRLCDCTPEDGVAPDGAFPSLTDPATQGCLLAMLAETATCEGYAVEAMLQWKWAVERLREDGVADVEAVPRALALALLDAWGQHDG